VSTLFTPEPQLPAKSARAAWYRIWNRLLLREEYPSRKLAARRTFLLLLGLSALFGAMCGLMVVYSIDLPQMEELAKYRPNTTTELLDIHGNVIGSFALERRVVVPFGDFPPVLRQAIISIEDKSFERNWGINLFRAAGAAYADVHSHSRAQGSSTLTMQLSRALFLSSEKTYSRKLQEIFLTLQIERRFTKDQIFDLYLNQIYLGHGRYGFEAGSEFYFSKHVKDLNLPEAALLAALPKGPEYYSPLRSPERALRRRNLVLSEMELDGKITPEQAAAAKAEPLGLKIERPPNSVAPYFVEEVRRQLEREYGVDEVHGAGLRVYTTLDVDLQKVANKAVLDGIARYERRHGWKGHLQNVIAAGLDEETYRHPDWTQTFAPGDYVHGMVTQVSARRVQVKLGRQTAILTPEDWAWTQMRSGDAFLKRGDLVYVRIEPGSPASVASSGVWDSGLKATLQQDSGVQGSMMALNNANGEVVAMVGGRDFALSQFNRATQSQRQVGSSFKPYDYVAAFEAGAKPTDVILDAPTTFMTPGGPYTPHDYESGFAGEMTLTTAFAQSRNVPALKLADKVGIRAVIAVARRFGVTSNLPAFLPVAIGAADITLAEQVGAYSVFPNDGIRIEPHYIRRVTQADGVPLDARNAAVTEVISLETARQMMVLLQAVVHQGTGAQAEVELHHPLGGKTGTTNDFTDAWFIGFSPSVTCGTWMGFDTRESLGKGEQGAKVALPMWIDFMRAAIAGKDDETFPTAGAPKKVLQVAVTPEPADDASKPADKTDEPQDPDGSDASDPTAAPHQAAPIVREPPPAGTPPSIPSGTPESPPRSGPPIPPQSATGAFPGVEPSDPRISRSGH
jgi:penicillin-binding protein 1A